MSVNRNEIGCEKKKDLAAARGRKAEINNTVSCK
jgi:hypothetical protein